MAAIVIEMATLRKRDGSNGRLRTDKKGLFRRQFTFIYKMRTQAKNERGRVRTFELIKCMQHTPNQRKF